MQKINIIDHFYPDEHWVLLKYHIQHEQYQATYQPKGIHYTDRLQAYPCWESIDFSKVENHSVYNITKVAIEKTFPSLKIKTLSTLFRKILKSEIDQSPFKNRDQGLLHCDEHADWAGVVYFNLVDSIKEGTYLHESPYHSIPHTIIGARQNRIAFYKSTLTHAAGIDPNINERYVQVIFITVEK